MARYNRRPRNPDGVRYPTVITCQSSEGLCLLCGNGFVAGVQRGAFLTGTNGADIRPENQLLSSDAESEYSTGYRVVLAGKEPVVREDGTPVRNSRGWPVYRNTFKWQKRHDPTGTWSDVQTWDHFVHVECATSRGFRLGPEKRVRHNGTRTVGVLNSTGAAESPLTELGRALDGPLPERFSAEPPAEGDAPAAP